MSPFNSAAEQGNIARRRSKLKYENLYRYQKNVADLLLKGNSSNQMVAEKINLILESHMHYQALVEAIRKEKAKTGSYATAPTELIQTLFKEFITNNKEEDGETSHNKANINQGDYAKLSPHLEGSFIATRELFKHKLSKNDLVIDLGGGTGRLLYYIAKNYCSPGDEPILINAEFNKDARGISDLIFSTINYPEKNFLSTGFDYYNPDAFYDKIFLKIISRLSTDSAVHIISTGSIEQVYELPKEFSKFIEKVCSHNFMIKFSFFEPIYFQLPSILSSNALKDKFSQGASSRYHNTNLWNEIIELTSNPKNNIRISKIVPLIGEHKDSPVGLSLVEIVNDLSILTRGLIH